MNVYNIRLHAIMEHYNADRDYLRARRELTTLENDILRHIRREEKAEDGDSTELHILHSKVDELIDATYKYEAFLSDPSKGALQALVYSLA